MDRDRRGDKSVQQKQAVRHAERFFYCVGMLITYYLTAELTDSVYSWAYIRLWIVFACFSPVMAYLVALTRRRGVLSLVLKVGIFAGYIGLNLLLGAFLKGYDILFFLLLIYLLFIRDRKTRRLLTDTAKRGLLKKEKNEKNYDRRLESRGRRV